jgi:hypothetical protein
MTSESMATYMPFLALHLNVFLPHKRYNFTAIAVQQHIVIPLQKKQSYIPIHLHARFIL